MKDKKLFCCSSYLHSLCHQPPIKEKLALSTNISIFSTPINIFKSLLQPSHNIESVLTSFIFLLCKSEIFNPSDIAYHFQDILLNKKAMWWCGQNTNNWFFHLLREKIPTLWTTERAIFIQTIARNYIQHKQAYLWFKANMIETCYENTTQTTTFWVLAETFKNTMYILQHQQRVHRLKLENLMSRCTAETTQTTMDTTLTTTFGILLKH